MKLTMGWQQSLRIRWIKVGVLGRKGFGEAVPMGLETFRGCRWKEWYSLLLENFVYSAAVHFSGYPLVPWGKVAGKQSLTVITLLF